MSAYRNKVTDGVRPTSSSISTYRANRRLQKAEVKARPIFIDGVAMEMISEFKFICIHIEEEQLLYLFHCLKMFGLSSHILSRFKNSSTESSLSSCVTTCYGKLELQRHLSRHLSRSPTEGPFKDCTRRRHNLFTLLLLGGKASSTTVSRARPSGLGRNFN